jgi:ribosome recycling factor
MYQALVEKIKPEIEKSIEHFKEELSQIRTGRASTALVDNLLVDYYGSKAPIKQVASVNVPEPRLIVISPWNKDDLISIEKVIRESQLNLNPNNDGQVIRISIPPLTEERRKELVKILSQKTEEAKITVRQHREEVWSQIQDLEKAGKIGEDEKFFGKEKLQEVVDEYNKKIEEIKQKKESEIMTV